MTHALRLLLASASIACAVPVAAQDASPAHGGGVDPLSASIDRSDAERFIALWQETGGHPTAEQLQARYIDPGSHALEVFTQGRIENGTRLAAVIARDNAAYADAIARCYPLVMEADGELRATYLALHGLLPEQPLPQIAVLFGAGNSGGTAAPGVQVLGLEVLCSLAGDEDAFRRMLRSFFAHETVHTMQDIGGDARDADPLLAWALREGTADYIAALVTGGILDTARDEWARTNEEQVLADFAADRAILLDPQAEQAAQEEAIYRWFANAGSPPEGWPSELGYWVGMRVAADYVANATDPHAAIRDLLALRDPVAVLEASGWAERLTAD